MTFKGYANVPEIAWEKLDNIYGNTEYVNELFEKPPTRSELKPAAGPTKLLNCCLLRTQRSQAESDYQLALARGTNSFERGC